MNGFESLYLQDLDMYPNEPIGTRLYLLFNKDEYFMNLTKHQRFSEMYDVDNGYLMVVFNLSTEEQNTIVKPMIEGKFSKIDREYANKHFMPTGYSWVDGAFVFGLSKTHQILFQNESLRRELSEELDVYIPDTAELASIPDLKNECFTKSIIQHEEQTP